MVLLGALMKEPFRGEWHFPQNPFVGVLTPRTSEDD